MLIIHYAQKPKSPKGEKHKAYKHGFGEEKKTDTSQFHTHLGIV